MKKSINNCDVPRKFDELEKEAKKFDSNQQNIISPIKKGSSSIVMGKN